MLRVQGARSRSPGFARGWARQTVIGPMEDSTGQVEDALNVKSLGKQIGQMGLRNPVSESSKNAQVSGQGRWVARDVNNFGDIEASQAAHHTFS